MNARILSNRLWVVSAALLAGALACNAPGANAGATPAPVTEAAGGGSTAATSEPGQPTATPVDPATICPQAGDGTAQYISKEYGFCFLYPSDLRGGLMTQPGIKGASFYGQPLNPNAPETFAAGIEVDYNGPADVASSADYATKWAGIYGQGASAPIPATIGGQSTLVIPDVPGMLTQQVGFVVANGQKYTVTASPAPAQVKELQAQEQKAWDTVTGSIVFFPPSDVTQVVRPEDVCPKPTDSTKLRIDYAGGVCVLYPASFEINPDYGSFEGGPVLGEMFSRPVRAEMNISYAGLANGQTPRQLFQPLLVNKAVAKMDEAGAQDVTLNGFPAIVWTNGAPLGARNAIIVANGYEYTIVNQPYNDPNFPGGADNIELVWTTVTQSVAFFTIWR